MKMNKGKMVPFIDSESEVQPVRAIFKNHIHTYHQHLKKLEGGHKGEKKIYFIDKESKVQLDRVKQNTTGKHIKLTGKTQKITAAMEESVERNLLGAKSYARELGHR